MSIDFMNEPAEIEHLAGALQISNFMHNIWLARPDLQAAFDLQKGEGQSAFIGWFESAALREYGLEPYIPEAGAAGRDRIFHAELLRYTGNGQLVELATSLRSRTRLYGLKILSDSNRLADSAQEHHVLLDLIEAGDGAAATELMRQHISHARGLWATGETETTQEQQT